MTWCGKDELCLYNTALRELIQDPNSESVTSVVVQSTMGDWITFSRSSPSFSQLVASKATLGCELNIPVPVGTQL